MNEEQMYAYVQSRDLSRHSRYCHIAILRNFIARTGVRYGVHSTLGLDSLIDTIRSDSEGRSLNDAAHRAGTLASFLNWYEQQGFGSNPFVELRARYGPWLLPVVRAIRRPDYREALEALDPKRWTSHLAPAMLSYLARGRALGHDFTTLERTFKQLDRFIQRNPSLATRSLKDVTEAWWRETNRPARRLMAYTCHRKLAEEQHRSDPNVRVPLADSSYKRAARKVERRPTVLSEQAIADLLLTAKVHYKGTVHEFTGYTMYAGLAVLCSTGIRVGELARLTLRDVDLDQCILHIRDTKFFKSRLVPFTASLKTILLEYRAQRAAIGANQVPFARFLCTPYGRSGYGATGLGGLLRRVLTAANLRRAHGRVGPRIHDLRHTFVQHRMLDFYRRGVDPQDFLPQLATYLGHKDIASTLAYIHSDPEILRFASDRFCKSVADTIRIGRQ
jgi:integrase/recombinase XerD